MRVFSVTNQQEISQIAAAATPTEVATYRSNIIEDVHMLNYGAGNVMQRSRSNKKYKSHKTPKATNTAALMYQNYETKSRSLERYSQPPHATLAAAIDVMPHPATLTPSLNARRRFLSPFKSMKRRSRSSSSSGGASSDVPTHTQLRHLPHMGMQQHQRQLQLHSASSQSGDSGTGGTELTVTEDCSRTSAAESSQLSLSYSQLSSHSRSSGSSCSLEAPANTDHSLQHATVSSITAPAVAEQFSNAGKVNERLVLDSADIVDEDSAEDGDGAFSEIHSYCGDITLVDDTYSNYDPTNDAERMFLQVVGILRDEKEV